MLYQAASALMVFLYHVSLLLYSGKSGPNVPLLALVSFSGLASYCIFKSYIKTSKSIHLRLSSRVYGALYLFEMNWAAHKEFHHEAKSRIDMALCLFTAVHIAKAVFVEMARPKLGNALKWYRDVIVLENYIHMARLGTKIGSDDLIIEHIRNSRKGHSPRVLFSILCDNATMNKLSGKLVLLDSIKAGKVPSTSLEGFGCTMTGPGSSAGPVLEETGLGGSQRPNGECYLPYSDLEKLESMDMPGSITEHSLARCLGEKDAKSCLRILTQGFQTELSYGDFYDNMRQINIERSSLINLVEGSDYTSRILALSSSGIEGILMISLLARIFNMADLVQYIVVPLLIFVFPVCLNLYDAFVFILYMRPYDIGDRVLLDEDNLVVKKIGLTSTTFERWNNELVIISNRHIKSRALRNIRRSRCQQWKIEMAILRSNFDKIDKLNKRMSAFVMENPAFENFEIVLDQITENSFVKVNFIIKHSINHQNGFFMWYVQNRFMRKLLEELNILRISYSPIEMRMQLAGSSA